MVYSKQIIITAFLALGAVADTNEPAGRAMFQGVSNVIKAVNQLAQQQGLSRGLVDDFYCPMTGEMADTVDDAEDLVKDIAKRGRLGSDTKSAIDALASSAESYIKYAGSNNMNCDKVEKLHEKVNDVRPFINKRSKCNDFRKRGGLSKRDSSEDADGLAQGVTKVIEVLDNEVKTNFNAQGLDKKEYSDDFICSFTDKLTKVIEEIEDLADDGAKVSKAGDVKQSAKSFSSSAKRAGVRCSDKLEKIVEKANKL
ncbi:hypothetical protein TRICI_004137 [Trichomonascus ciferrii]|uniref:Uncharacterized protein n=1 Tax=Trichomonascus ciferrii TaxID=44093 RepID=A0A642V1A3_9ASCO|nr:hypothetical protein TRICI_004137 [Trichomonascus ciferrii]